MLEQCGPQREHVKLLQVYIIASYSLTLIASLL